MIGGLWLLIILVFAFTFDEALYLDRPPNYVAYEVSPARTPSPSLPYYRPLKDSPEQKAEEPSVK